MASLKWYRWWPGAIPQLERVSPEIRGLAHALMDALWVNPSCIDEPAEMCRVLMLPCSTETAKVLNNLLPALEQFIDYERDDYNGHHDAKVEAGRKGGLARAERAKQTQAVLSSASSSQAHPSILPSSHIEAFPIFFSYPYLFISHDLFSTYNRFNFTKYNLYKCIINQSRFLWSAFFLFQFYSSFNQLGQHSPFSKMQAFI